jgi:hypothetical protein
LLRVVEQKDEWRTNFTVVVDGAVQPWNPSAVRWRRLLSPSVTIPLGAV